MIKTNSTRGLYKRGSFERARGQAYIQEIKDLKPLTKGLKLNDGQITDWNRKLATYGKLGKSLEEIELVLPVNAEYTLEDLLVNDPSYLVLIETYCNALYEFILEKKRYVEVIMLMPKLVPENCEYKAEASEEPPKYKLDATIKYIEKLEKYFHKLRDRYKSEVKKVNAIKSSAEILEEQKGSEVLF